MLSRRGFVLSTGLLGCSCPAEPTRIQHRDAGWRSLSFPASFAADAGQQVLLLADSARPRPMLVALHGRGEAGRGLEVGATAWRDSYDIDRIRRALLKPPIADDVVFHMERAERLDAINRSLARHPFQDLTLLCPYTPIVSRADTEGAMPFARFLTQTLIPRVRGELGGLHAEVPCGIDGVSMGGRLALLVGFAFPKSFQSVGALQPAIASEEAEALALLAKRAATETRQTLRLVSSRGDPFLEAIRAFSAALQAQEVPHTLVVTDGPHDYVWNRGPGGLELLLHHERALRGLEAP